jgi:hypothetical protein
MYFLRLIRLFESVCYYVSNLFLLHSYPQLIYLIGPKLL